MERGYSWGTAPQAGRSPAGGKAELGAALGRTIRKPAGVLMWLAPALHALGCTRRQMMYRRRSSLQSAALPSQYSRAHLLALPLGSAHLPTQPNPHQFMSSSVMPWARGLWGEGSACSSRLEATSLHVGNHSESAG